MNLGFKKKHKDSHLASNPVARFKYLITETIEVGIVLQGTEVKSIRNTSPHLRDAYVQMKASAKNKQLEAWLLNAYIGPYSHGNRYNHESIRPRKLLLHAEQLRKFDALTRQKGYSIVPLKMYLKRGLIKLEIGLGKGKKEHDKREALKKKALERDAAQERN